MISPAMLDELVSAIEARLRAREPRTFGPCVIGTVSAVSQETGRVKVKHIWLGPTTKGQHKGQYVESDWLTVALPLAGKDSAVCFLPDPAHEVLALIVLPGGQISNAVVVGFMPSTVDRLPAEIRGGKQGIAFGDGTGVLLQPKTNDQRASVVIADSNGNRIELSENGIEIMSAKNITLTASGAVILNGESVEVVGTRQVEIEGPKVTQEATGGDFKIKGKTVHIN